MTSDVLAFCAVSVGFVLGVAGFFAAYALLRERAAVFMPLDVPPPKLHAAPSAPLGASAGDAGTFRALPQQTAVAGADLPCFTCGQPKNIGTHPNC